ncbi:MAG: hypothetical protein J3K34DRAFT_525141 [Monoraphidium minutum]|nr:MAG: hypothetical protein J3K34DRAFT_525141 [Monoraphidium minutum]
MLRGLLELAHGAQTAPVPACSCAKGLAVGVACLQSALRGASGRGAAQRRPGTALGSGSGSGGGGGGGGGRALSAAFHSVDTLSSGMAAHDAHALRMELEQLLDDLEDLEAAADAAAAAEEEADELGDALKRSLGGGQQAEGSSPASTSDLQRLEKLLWSLMKDSTCKKYMPYITKFKEWCGKQGYSPDLSSMADIYKARGYLEWFVYGAKGDNSRHIRGRAEGGKLGPDAAMVVHGALCTWARACTVRQGGLRFKLRDDQQYEIVYRSVTKGRRSKGKSAGQRGITEEEFMTMMKGLLASPEARDIVTHTIIAHQTQTCGRGDDVRPVAYNTWDLQRHDDIGPLPADYLKYSREEHKSNSGNPVPKSLLRHKVPELDAIGAHARLLWLRFVKHGEPLPALGSSKMSWFLCFPGANPSQPVSYRYHNDWVSEALARFGIWLAKKRTHAFRKLCAQMATNRGMPLELLQRIGDWLQDCFGSAYADVGTAPQALLALGGWSLGSDQKSLYYAPRFRAAVPEELIDFMLPGLKGLEEEAAAAAAAAATQQEQQQAARDAKQLARVLRFIMMCGIQDAYEVANKYPANPFYAQLLGNATFKNSMELFQAAVASGLFDAERPPASMVEMMQRLEQGNAAMEERMLAVLTGEAARGCPPLALLPRGPASGSLPPPFEPGGSGDRGGGSLDGAPGGLGGGAPADDEAMITYMVSHPEDDAGSGGADSAAAAAAAAAVAAAVADQAAGQAVQQFVEQQQQRQQDSAAPGNTQQALHQLAPLAPAPGGPQQAVVVAAAAGGAPKPHRAIPFLKTLPTVVETTMWYQQKPPGFDATRQQLEEDAELRDLAWRKPHKVWKQRWGEVKTVIDAAWKRRREMLLNNRREVSLLDAAAAIDTELQLPAPQPGGMTVATLAKVFHGDVAAAAASLAARPRGGGGGDAEGARGGGGARPAAAGAADADADADADGAALGIGVGGAGQAIAGRGKRGAGGRVKPRPGRGSSSGSSSSDDSWDSDDSGSKRQQQKRRRR